MKRRGAVGGVKRRKNAPKAKAPAAVFSENGTLTELLDLLKKEERTTGCVSEQSMSDIAARLIIPLSEVYGVASFYSFLHRKPRGAHVIRICKSLPCYLKDAPIIIEGVKKAIGIEPGETTSDGRFSFALTNCIGACDQAPAMLVDDTVHGNLTPDKIGHILKSYGEV